MNIKYELKLLVSIVFIIIGYDIFFNEINNILFSTGIFYVKNIYLNETPILRGILLNCLKPALAEELIYRVFIIKLFRYFMPDSFAVIGSAIIFALVHYYPLAIIQIFPIGILLAIIYIYTNNILYCIAMHFLHNFYLLIIQRIKIDIPGYTPDSKFANQMFYFTFLGFIFLVFGIYIFFKTYSYKKRNITA